MISHVCSQSHPYHDEVAAEVAGWFTTSAPEMSYRVRARPYGYLTELGANAVRAILRVEEPDEVAPAVASVVLEAAGRPIVLWVEDRTRNRSLAPALEEAGCRPGTAITHLALVGALRVARGPSQLSVEVIDADALERWATVKLKCFADSEEEPDPTSVQREVDRRRGELARSELWIGSLADEPAAVLAHFTGVHRLVFNLGTRLCFRHRGVAQEMLGRFAAAGERDGCRSLMINAIEGERPEELYRRIGFTDEIYWYQSYRIG